MSPAGLHNLKLEWGSGYYQLPTQICWQVKVSKTRFLPKVSSSPSPEESIVSLAQPDQLQQKALMEGAECSYYAEGLMFSLAEIKAELMELNDLRESEEEEAAMENLSP
ncbi:hypothetical protein EYF80_005806 [Liparis tanakae]|uniref:Uncharacterized protein n=1 Tax=Liparis tanakae TaxID=230148 RepID=A0A4Z2J0T4_9TELE|nr:hypothetical protein EYF80_005806 [Liparis tanakae]